MYAVTSCMEIALAWVCKINEVVVVYGGFPLTMCPYMGTNYPAVE